MLRWKWITLVSFAFVVGCAGSATDDGAEEGDRVFRIAVIPKGTTHAFWKSVEAGARRADSEFDDVEITWKGPLSENDTSSQIKTVESFIIDGYDAICLAPLDAQALRGPVDQALQAGIPVLIFDSALRDPSGTVSYVASDNYEGGRLAAAYLAELLGGKGNAIMMRYMQNSESTEQREKGFMDEIANHAGIKMISTDKHAGADERGGRELGENLLQNFGDQVEGIFCPNESTTSGMLTALRQYPGGGLAGKVRFVGFDSGANLESGLVAGELHGTVLQDPTEMGYLAVVKVRDHLLGTQVDERVPTRVHVAKFDSLGDPLTVELLGRDVRE